MAPNIQSDSVSLNWGLKSAYQLVPLVILTRNLLRESTQTDLLILLEATRVPERGSDLPQVTQQVMAELELELGSLPTVLVVGISDIIMTGWRDPRRGKNDLISHRRGWLPTLPVGRGQMGCHEVVLPYHKQ